AGVRGPRRSGRAGADLLPAADEAARVRPGAGRGGGRAMAGQSGAAELPAGAPGGGGEVRGGEAGGGSSGGQHAAGLLRGDDCAAENAHRQGTTLANRFQVSSAPIRDAPGAALVAESPSKGPAD